MKRKAGRTVTLLFTLLLLLSGCQSQQDKARLTALKTIYEGAKQSFAYWALVPELDWDGLYRDYKPKVLAAGSDWEYFQTLRRFTAHLRDGHTQLSLPYEAPFQLPLYLRYVEGRFVLWALATDAGDIPLGSVIEQIDGVDAESWLESQVGDQLGLHTPGARQDALAGLAHYRDRADTLTLAGTAPDGAAFEAEATYTDGDINAAQVLSIEPTGDALGGHYYGMKAYSHGDGIYQVTLPNFQDARLQESFARFIADYGEQATAFILDARGNHGGNSMYGADILTYFHPYEDLTSIYAANAEEDTLPEDYDNVVAELYTQFDLEKDVLLAQPVIILADWHCGSAGDNFVAMAKDTGRFTIMGTHTKGGTGQAAVYDLATGRPAPLSDLMDGVYPERFVLFSSRRTLWGEAGHEIINVGIPPDIRIEQSVADFQAGVDTVLALALKTLRQAQ